MTNILFESADGFKKDISQNYKQLKATYHS